MAEIHKLLDNYTDGLHMASIKFLEITANKMDKRSFKEDEF